MCLGVLLCVCVCLSASESLRVLHSAEEKKVALTQCISHSGSLQLNRCNI